MNENVKIMILFSFPFSFSPTLSHMLAVMRLVAFQADNFTFLFFNSKKRFFFPDTGRWHHVLLKQWKYDERLAGGMQ